MESELIKELENKISREPDLAKLSLKISCEDGIVYLEGEAEEWKQVVALGHLAASVSGVKGIVNRVWPKDLPRPEKRKKVLEKASWDGMKSDVVVVGAGIVGAAIARELARYDLRVVLVEKEADVGWGQTKSGSAWIHGFAGIDVDPESLKAKLCVKGNAMYDKLSKELDFPFRRVGLLAIVTEPELVPLLDYAKDIIEKHGTRVEIIKEREKIFDLEPNVTEKAVAALWFPTYGVVSPYLVTIALVENAVANGVRLLLQTEVIDVLVENNEIKGIITNRGKIFTRFLINAAGLYADEIAEMAGAQEFTIHPRKGETLVLDKKCASSCFHNLAPATLKEDPYTKGGGIALTVDGNLLWGPSAEEIPSKDDLTITKEGIEKVWKKFSSLLPDIQKGMIIRAYAGLRAATYTEDFHISPSRKVKGLINVGGIQSPGITAAPAIAELVLDILRREGLQLEEKPDFDPVRKSVPSFRDLSNQEREKLIADDPRYGHVVCRCEHVTEGEVIEAIKRGATTLDGIKFRTRAGMGRCQGGFCTPHLIKILARELRIRVSEITRRGGESRLLPYEAKSLLLEASG